MLVNIQLEALPAGWLPLKTIVVPFTSVLHIEPEVIFKSLHTSIFKTPVGVPVHLHWMLKQRTLGICNGSLVMTSVPVITPAVTNGIPGAVYMKTP